MSFVKFVWDPDKAQANIQKHDVSFEEAMTVFRDVNALRKFDKDHSDDEDRFVIIGFSTSLRMLFVCHCYVEDDATIRLISARKASKKEQATYFRRSIYE